MSRANGLPVIYPECHFSSTVGNIHLHNEKRCKQKVYPIILQLSGCIVFRRPPTEMLRVLTEVTSGQ